MYTILWIYFLKEIFGLRLGLIENNPNLIGLCKAAINDAVKAGQCRSNIE